MKNLKKSTFNISISILSIICIFMLLSCSKSDDRNIRITNSYIELISDSAYVTLSIVNESETDTVKKIDLSGNFSTIEDNLYIFPVECCIHPQDSSKLRFRVNCSLEDISPDFYIVSKTIALRYSDNKRKYFTGKDLLGRFELNKESRDREIEDDGFKFLGEGHERKDNFNDYPGDVTVDNVEYLYREYNVDKIPSTDIYRVSSKRLYNDARYFTRLLKFKQGKQVAAQTFYGYDIPYVFVQDDKYLIALNSLSVTSKINSSTFNCKTILLDNSLNIINQRIYSYNDFTYTYVDTLVQTKKGYDFTVINIGFDGDSHYEYKGTLNFNNQVVSSSKRMVCDL